MTIEKLLKNKKGYIRENGLIAYELKDEDVFAFLPKSFNKFKGIIWYSVYPVSFKWTGNVPNFRFKVKLVNPSPLFFSKYSIYLKTLNIKEQYVYHQYPNALLKNWKNKPKLFNRKSKETINYREDFFAYTTKSDPDERMSFLEIFSLPIEHELIRLSKNKDITEVKFSEYYPILLASRQLFISEYDEFKSKNGELESTKVIAKNYKGIKRMWENNIMNSLNIITDTKPFADILPGSVSLKYIYIYEIEQNLPLGLQNYVSGIIDNIFYNIFPLLHLNLLFH